MRTQWLDGYKRIVDESVFVRSRLAAMQIALEARTDCFAGTPCIVLCKTGVELGSHAVQRSEKHIV